MRTEVEKDASGNSLLDGDGCGLLLGLIAKGQYALDWNARSDDSIPPSRPCWGVAVLAMNQYSAWGFVIPSSLTEHFVYVKKLDVFVVPEVVGRESSYERESAVKSGGGTTSTSRKARPDSSEQTNIHLHHILFHPHSVINIRQSFQYHHNRIA